MPLYVPDAPVGIIKTSDRRLTERGAYEAALLLAVLAMAVATILHCGF
jgi:hypothetical protein